MLQFRKFRLQNAGNLEGRRQIQADISGHDIGLHAHTHTYTKEKVRVNIHVGLHYKLQRAEAVVGAHCFFSKRHTCLNIEFRTNCNPFQQPTRIYLQL